MRWLGPALIVGGLGVGVWWYTRPDSWESPLQGLVTSRGGTADRREGAAGPSAAQVLLELRQDEARLERERDDQRAYIEDEYRERRNRYQFGTAWMNAESERVCGGVLNLNPFNPYGACDDELQKALLQELDRWRDREERKLRAIEQELRSVQAEIESAVLVAA